MSLSKVILSTPFQVNLCSWLVVIVAGFYNIVAMIPLILNVPSTPFSMGYRAVYLSISILIIVVYALRKGVKNFTITYGLLFIVLFWLVYGTRLIYDVSIAQIPLYTGYTAQYLYLYAFGACLLPALAVGLLGNKLNFDLLIKRLFYVFLINNIVIILYVVSNFGFGFHLFSTRGMLHGHTNDVRVINAISLSLSGTYLLFMAMTNLVFSKVRRIRYLSYFALPVGLFCLIFGASRGPLATTILITLFLIAFHFKNSRIGIKYISKFLIAFAFLFFIGKYYLAPILIESDLNIVWRLVDMAEKDHQEERTFVMEQGWQDFVENPIVGNQIFVTVDRRQAFVHNNFLEILHSTGITGGFIFVCILFLIIKKSIRIFNNRSKLFYILGVLLISLSFSTTSGALYLDPNFWLFISLTLTISPSIVRKFHWDNNSFSLV